MDKIYILTYMAYGSNDTCVSCVYFKNKDEARKVKEQYKACGHINVQILELSSN